MSTLFLGVDGTVNFTNQVSLQTNSFSNIEFRGIKLHLKGYMVFTSG